MPVVSKNEEVGGINLDPAMMDLQIKRDGKGVPLPLNQQPMSTMKINGFFPILINITPINVPMLLGVVRPDKNSEKVGFDFPKDPMKEEELSSVN